MKKNSIIKSGFRVMRRYKLRTFFMMLGIIIGIMSLTLILSLGKGTRQGLMDKVERLISSSDLLVNAGGAEMMSTRGPDGPTTTLTLEDIEEIARQVPNVEAYDAIQMIVGRSVKYMERSADLRIMGSTPNGEVVWNRSVTSGSYFTEADMKQSSRVALLGPRVVEELFDGADPVGEQVRIGSVPFRVIGVLEPMGIDPHGMDRDYEILVPLSTIMRRLMNVDFIMAAKLQLADASLMQQTAGEVGAILRERHHVGGGEPDDFTLVTPEQVQRIIAGMNRVFSVFLPLIAGIALIAGGVVVTALMLIMVSERKNEIGLRKALGARAKDIRLQFVIETAVITVAGGLAGFFLGTLGVQAMVIKMKLPTIIPWEAFSLGMIFSIVVGMTAGLVPAKRAAQLEPVEALR